jgi:hypothetical protein
MGTFKRLIFTLSFSLMTIHALFAAQASDCPTVVRVALDATKQACEATARNQACYGNVALEATPRDGAADFKFNTPGDLAEVATLSRLQLTSMDASRHQWGIAMMRLQANLPDTLPGQNVTLLLFGNVNIQDATTVKLQPILLDGTASGSANVRHGPSKNEAVIDSFKKGQIVKIDGRTQSGDWLRVQLDDGNFGWVSAPLFIVNGDMSALPVKDASSAQLVESGSELSPMQAFYFTSGVGDTPCHEAPESGILIQSPKGASRVKLLIDEVQIVLGSTLFVQARPTDGLVINVLEGSAEVTTNGVTRYVSAGARVRVPLDQNLAAAGAPGDIDAYPSALVLPLPVSVLQQVITPVDPLTQDQLDAAKNPFPLSGTWSTLLVMQGPAYCVMPPNNQRTFSGTGPFTFASEDNGNTLVWSFGSTATRWKRESPGLYVGAGIYATHTLRVISPSHFMDTGTNNRGCPVAGDYTLVQAG